MAMQTPEGDLHGVLDRPETETLSFDLAKAYLIALETRLAMPFIAFLEPESNNARVNTLTVNPLDAFKALRLAT